MRRAYASIADAEGDLQIHYRTHGSGPPLVLLHPSPLSSQALAPQIEQLSRHFTCIAWDTPGYGCSDPLPSRWDKDHSLRPYVECLSAFLDALGLEQPLIYGSATGAQIAIEFARFAPSRCGGLLLENIALFDEHEAEAIIDRYFPDISARGDGSHLSTIWDMAARSTRFFPWYAEGQEAERRKAYAPAPLIDMVVRDTLLAGPGYDRAYRAAFANEREDRLQDLTVKTRILLWDEGLLGEYGARVASIELPSKVVIRRAGEGMASRLSALTTAAEELAALESPESEHKQ